MAGIDFEPNEATQQIAGVQLRSIRLLRNAGAGLEFGFHAYSAKSPPCSVQLTDTLIVGPLTTAPSAGGPAPTAKAYRRWAILFEAWTPSLPAGIVGLDRTVIVDGPGWGSPLVWVEKPASALAVGETVISLTPPVYPY